MSKPLEIERVVFCEPKKGAKGVEIIAGEFLPSEFELAFTHASLDSEEGKLWLTSFVIKTESDGIPRCVEVKVLGNAMGGGGVELLHRGRVEPSHFLAVAKELRFFEGMAVAECMRILLLDNDGKWQLRASSTYQVDVKEVPATLTDEQFKKIRRIVENANSYTKRSPEFLREVLKVYNDAKARNKRTNLEVQKYFDAKNNRSYSITTVRSWIAEAKKLDGQNRQVKSVGNSSPTKPVSKKAKATPKTKGKQ